jgi:hypothetical protein
VVKFVVREKRFAPKISLSFGAGIRISEKAHGGIAIQSLHIWSHSA